MIMKEHTYRQFYGHFAVQPALSQGNLWTLLYCSSFTDRMSAYHSNEMLLCTVTLVLCLL